MSEIREKLEKLLIDYNIKIRVVYPNTDEVEILTNFIDQYANEKLKEMAEDLKAEFTCLYNEQYEWLSKYLPEKINEILAKHTKDE